VGKFYKIYRQTFLGNLPVKGFWKLLCNCWSYDQKSCAIFETEYNCFFLFSYSTTFQCVLVGSDTVAYPGFCFGVV